MNQIFRSKAALILAWIWTAFAALNAVDLVVRFSGASSIVAAAVLGVLSALVFITCVRPATVLRDDGVLVRNPLRNALIPWAAVDDVRVSHSIMIKSGGRAVRCSTPQATARERTKAVRRANAPSRQGRYQTEPVRTKAEQTAAEAVGGKTHADWVAEQIVERADAARRSGTDPGSMRISWSIPALAALGAALALVIAAFVVA